MEKNKFKQRPDFKSEDEEREFWATHELEEYFDMDSAEIITETGRFPNLKLTEGLISLQLDLPLAKELKVLAKEKSVDLAVLAAQYVKEGVLRDARHVAR